MEKKHKILVVDDDPKALILMEAVLESHGYDVVLINDGGQVI
jgi:CheY-like chemotaxis protein